MSSYKNERPRPSRGLLVSPDLQAEISGQDERGIKPPLIRLPGKTHLANVLLSSNPWEGRDLDRRLERIQKQKNRKVRSLEWTQRQFFVNKIFDQDYNLRFGCNDFSLPCQTPIRQPSAAAVSQTLMHEKGNEAVATENREGIVKLPKIKRVSLGVFAPPAPKPKKSKRIEVRMKLSMKPAPIAQKEKTKVLTVAKLPKLANVSQLERQCPNVGRSSPKNSMMFLTDSPVGSEFDYDAMDDDVFDDNDLDVDNEEDDNSEDESEDLDFGKSRSSQIDLQVEKSRSNLPSQRGEKYEKSSQVLQMPNVRRQSDAKSELHLCREDVITRLTRTLPVSMMMRANQNLNKIIFDRKRRMLESSRRASTMDTFCDPRWRNLNSSLAESREQLQQQ